MIKEQTINLKQVAFVVAVTCLMLIALMMPIQKAEAVTIEELQAQIAVLMAQLAELQANAGTTGGTSGSGTTSSQCYKFTYSMYLGSSDRTTNGEVTKLQQYLTSTGDYTYGAPTGYYGQSTMDAVKKWQARNGVVSSGTSATTGYGLVGTKTREALNNSCSSTSTPTPTPGSPSIDVTSPKEGDVFDSDGNLTIKWAQNGLETISIALYKDNKWAEWIKKDASVTSFANNTYMWDIPENLSISDGKNLKIYITGRLSDGTGYRDDKSGEFSMNLDGAIVVEVSTSTPTGSLKVTHPNGGEVLSLGFSNTITWSPYSYSPLINPASDVTAYLEKKNRYGRYETIGKIMENGKASIHTQFEIDKFGNPATPGQYYVRIVNNKTGETDRSDNAFSLYPAMDIELAIDGSDSYIQNLIPGSHTFTWNTKNTNSCEGYTYSVSDDGKGNITSNLASSDWDGVKRVSGSQTIQIGNEKTGKSLYVLGCSNKFGSGATSVEVTFIYGSNSITVLTPNGGETWKVGEQNTITWKPYNYNPDVNVSSGVTAYLEKKTSTGQYSTVGKIMENGKASIHTHLEIDQYANYAQSGEYYVRLVNNKTGATDRSDRAFKVVNQSSACYVSSYDYDNNKKIESNDAQLLGNYLNSSCPSGKICDINQNGDFTIADVTALHGLIGGNTQWCTTKEPLSCYYAPYDYNDDKRVDSADATSLLDYGSLNYPSGYCPTGKICDVNKNGIINSTDATALNRVISGATSCPSGTPTPTPTACYIKEYDLDNGKVLGQNDLAIISDIILGNRTCPTGKICDINQDGEVNVLDGGTLRGIMDGTISCKIIEPKQTPAPAACYYTSYDLDNSGKIDEGDKKVISDVYLGTRSCPSGKMCDINKDGNVNSGDTVAIAMIIGGDKTWCPSTESVACYYAPYDLDGNGSLGDGDYTVIQHTILGTACPAGKVCDISGDGVVSIFDYGSLRNIISGTTACPAVLGASTSQANLASIIEGLENLVEALREFITR